ncbi:hypothetical protein L9F63_017203, partial [Diploptera punctata]
IHLRIREYVFKSKEICNQKSLICTTHLIFECICDLDSITSSFFITGYFKIHSCIFILAYSSIFSFLLVFIKLPKLAWSYKVLKEVEFCWGVSHRCTFQLFCKEDHDSMGCTSSM